MSSLTSERLVPTDSLRAVFTEGAIARLLQHPARDYHLEHRLNVLGASGPRPSNPLLARSLQHWKVEKAAWDAYLTTAFRWGLFECEGGRDLRGRLVDPGYENFMSAMDECATSWLLTGIPGLEITPRPRGGAARILEMRASYQGEEFNVEVKSPHRQFFMEPGVVYRGSGDNSDALSGALESAAKQLPKGQANLLVVFPRFVLPVASNRRMILNAFYGQDTINIPINKASGEPIGDPYIGFRAEGHLLRTRKAEGKPRYTRVSAIMTVEERLEEMTTEGGKLEIVMCHDVLVAHNPHAEIPISGYVWGCWPQLVHEDGVLSWTDGHSLTGWE